MIQKTVMTLVNAFFKIQKDYPQFTDQMSADFIKGVDHCKVDIIRIHNGKRHLLETIQLHHCKDVVKLRQIADRCGFIFNQKNFDF